MAFIAAAVYAYIAAGQKDVMTVQALAMGAQIHSMQDQLLTMDQTLGEIRKQTPGILKSAQAAEGQLASTERSAQPWIGIDNPEFIPVDQFRIVWPDERLPSPEYDLIFRYSLKNFGSTPGFNEDERVTWDPVRDRPKALPQLKDACMIDAYRSGKVTLEGDIGEMILPGGIKPSGVDRSTGFSDAAQTRRNLHRIWVTVCINYSDARGIWHFSGYRYISKEPTGAAPIAIPNHPDWPYVPVSGLVLTSAAAE